jgi:hypothetical protein
VRIRSPKALIEAIRLTRNYLRDGKYHPSMTKWHWLKARRVLEVEASFRWGWKMRSRWSEHLREIGLNPESLEVVDPARWEVALDLFYDPAFEREFPIDEFKRRLALSRLAGTQSETQLEQPNSREVFLDRIGIELD